MNPAIVRFSGKTFVANGSMVEVESGITLQEACQRYPPAKSMPKSQDPKTKSQDPKTKSQDPKTKSQDPKEYQILSSKGDKYYTVSVENDLYSCTCPGYGWRRKCRHIEGIKSQ